MAYQFPQKVLFRHCDPAGIVFFPRYFEMMNDCVEAFFEEVLEHPFEELLKSGGVPTGKIETRFTAPSRQGDQLTLTLTLERLGTSSLSYMMTAHCGDERRFETTATLVHVGENGRSRAWPAPLRSKIQAFKDASK